MARTKRYAVLSILLAAALMISVPSWAQGISARLASDTYKAGAVISVEGTIPPGEDLYMTIAAQDTFANVETDGPHETKTLKADGEKFGFTAQTRIPILYYVLTNRPDVFGEVVKKKFGGPSFMSGLYSTTMFKLAEYDNLSAEAKEALGPIDTAEQWRFFKYAHEKKFGINTITKEQTKVGKITIFSRSVLTDYDKSGNYWDEGTSINLDKSTGKFLASFDSFRHTQPGKSFDVFVNGEKIGSYTMEGKGFWLSTAYRYMNPLWIIIGAILVGAYFSMIGAAGGMLMAAYQVMIVQTSSPVGINAANVLRPSNVALTLFSPLGSFYRYAVVERRVAWPVGLSFGVGILIGSIWLGKYATAVLPMAAYKEWLAVLVVIMGIRTLYELSPQVMEKRKNIKAMVQKFNKEVAAAKAEGRAAEMGKIEPVKSGLTNYRFKFWGEEFTINPLLFGILGLAIGVVSRSFGIGGGFLLVPAMTTLGALPMYVAVPISLIGTCFSSIGSFIGYIINGYWPDLWLFIAIIVGGFVGGMLGSRLQKLFSEVVLKWILAITLFFLFFRFFKIEIWI